MERYKKEKEFLENVERHSDSSNGRRTRLTVQEIQSLSSQHLGIPQDFLDYLIEIGSGTFRECQFSAFGWLGTIDDIPGYEGHSLNNDVLFFGHNFTGDLSGFCTNRDWEVVEYIHETNELYYTKLKFHQYIREQMLIDKDGNDMRTAVSGSCK